MSSSNSVKSKKNSKEREKRKSQNTYIENNGSDKGSPSKDSKQYAGISSESIYLQAEQILNDRYSDEALTTLAEDINYKLRYIIHDSLVRARLSGRDIINSKDIEESMKSLSVEKIYGATSSPNWVPLRDHNVLYLDDTIQNLVELAEEENTYAQHGEVTLRKQWFPNADTLGENSALKNYFVNMCQAVISQDDELRRTALTDISQNPRVGPLMEYFYHFGYFLLMKDITYDCLTLSALDLIETLENSPLGNPNVSEKQLHLLTRLLFQRLLISSPNKEVLKPMCSVLALLSLRQPLRHLVIVKINQKLSLISPDNTLPVLMTIYFLGMEAIEAIFLPNIINFLVTSYENQCQESAHVLLSIYGIICKASHNNMFIQSCFREVFGKKVVPCWQPTSFHGRSKLDLEDSLTVDVNFVPMKRKLIRTRRKVDCNIQARVTKPSLMDVFELPKVDCKVLKKIEEHRSGLRNFRKETHVIVGKMTLLLPEFKKVKMKSTRKYCDHSLLSYNL